MSDQWLNADYQAEEMAELTMGGRSGRTIHALESRDGFEGHHGCPGEGAVAEEYGRE